MASAAPAKSNPWHMGWPEHRAVFLRAWKEAGQDNVGLVAAGVAFYGFLAIVPLLGATVLTYGLIAEPETVIRQIRDLTQIMPADAAKLIGEQLLNVVQTSDGKKGFGLLLALGVALFGARNGAGAIITALNIAYEEEEKRNFFWVNLTALAITGAAVIVAIVAGLAITMLGALDEMIGGAPAWSVAIGRILSYVVLALAGAAAAASLYRYGPSRARPRWSWITPGSVLSAIGWLALTLGFGIYVANFGNYNATYGSLGAVVVLLTWLYLSSYILLLGAELNSEYEHQTESDTTTGSARPMGERGAWVADHVASDARAADMRGTTPQPPIRPVARPPSPLPVQLVLLGVGYVIGRRHR